MPDPVDGVVKATTRNLSSASSACARSSGTSSSTSGTPEQTVGSRIYSIPQVQGGGLKRRAKSKGENPSLWVNGRTNCRVDLTLTSKHGIKCHKMNVKML